jgi:ElaB/YqjD/DUF883 family membrane-anchored ribosome-binding protein
MAQPLKKTPEPLTNQEPITHQVPAEGPTLVIASTAETLEQDIGEWHEPAGGKLDEMNERASEMLEDAQDRISEAYDQAKSRAAYAYENMKQKSVEIVEQARDRARYWSDEYPLQVIAGVAGVAFLLGVGLRIWRSNRYE